MGCGDRNRRAKFSISITDGLICPPALYQRPGAGVKQGCDHADLYPAVGATGGRPAQDGRPVQHGHPGKATAVASTPAAGSHSNARTSH